jgi:polyhydroxyalkanoate synthase subunit PhaC
MDSEQPLSTLSEMARSWSPPNDTRGVEGRGILPGEVCATTAAEAAQAHPPEALQADRAFHAMLARLTGGISPVALSLACFDWAAHLAAAPERSMQIAQDAAQRARQLSEHALHYFSSGRAPWSLIRPQPQDRRFAAPEWELPPFNMLAQAFLLNQQWWHNATTGVRGVAPQNEAIVEFSVRQMLDMLAPSNLAATNPEVLQKAFQSGGENFVHRAFPTRLATTSVSREAARTVG